MRDRRIITTIPTIQNFKSVRESATPSAAYANVMTDVGAIVEALELGGFLDARNASWGDAGAAAHGLDLLRQAATALGIELVGRGVES